MALLKKRQTFGVQGLQEYTVMYWNIAGIVGTVFASTMSVPGNRCL